MVSLWIVEGCCNVIGKLFIEEKKKTVSVSGSSLTPGDFACAVSQGCLFADFSCFLCCRNH